MKTLDELAPQLVRSGLQRVTIVEVHCRACGDLRGGLEAAPAARHPCPKCGETCTCALLGVGLTRHPLPFWTPAELDWSFTAGVHRFFTRYSPQ